jgi:hypothetical protein
MNTPILMAYEMSKSSSQLLFSDFLGCLGFGCGLRPSLHTAMTEKKVSQMDSSKRYLILVVSSCRKGGGVNLKDLRKANPSDHSDV